MNASRQQIEQHMNTISDEIRAKLQSSFTNLPVNEAAVATTAVLSELAITYAIVAGLSAPAFVAAILTTWNELSKDYEQFCQEHEANEHLH